MPVLQDGFPARAKGCSNRANCSGFLLMAPGHSVVIELDGRRRVLAAGAAIWVPDGLTWQATTGPAEALTVLALDLPAQPASCGPTGLTPSPLMLALAQEIALAREPLRRAALSGLLGAELLQALADDAPGRFPDLAMPSDPRLARLCRAILEEPADRHDLDHWAKLAAMSRRTLTRTFQRQTGLSLARWAQQARMAKARAMLAQGLRVTEVGLAVGYDTPSAFAAAFRKAMGSTPSAFAQGAMVHS